MSKQRIYALDANIFIEAKRRYYPFDICPGFWEALAWHQAQGQIGSIDKVKHELEQGNDDLENWLKTSMPAICFASTDGVTVTKLFGQIFSWVQAQSQFNTEAKAEFADDADGWLVAHAKLNGLVLVTHEIHARDARRKVPIPNICMAFQVEYVDTFTMLRDLRAKFTWLPPL